MIDNYIDENVLTILDKRRPRVSAEIYTVNDSEQLLLDIRRHDAQYPPLEIKTAGAFGKDVLIA